ncbi:hypothetical protein [Microvirga solisilvae]|uniref:hypothetical protein n=1 Tax=Microvirga solisilvae TaxID=2919498 RepID=UPI001FAF595C|nr:hypothetical protein [Microvirga solisilvae]
MYRAALLLAGLTLAASPAMAETVERAVKANATSAIGGFFGYEVNTCYSSIIPDVKVKQAPANGSFRIVPFEQTLGKDTSCAGKKVRGLAYVYTPKKGFTGSDEVVLDVPWSGNDHSLPTVYTNTYRIKVQ